MNGFKFVVWCFVILSFSSLKADVALQATSTTSSTWNTGYVTAITLTNSTTTPISSWKINFSLPTQQTINCLWNGTYTQTNQNVAISNQADNAVIEPGESIVIGFQVNNPLMLSQNPTGLVATGVPSAPSPAGIVLNATYKVDTVWATAFQATVTLTNLSSTATSSWTAAFTLPSGYSLSTYTSNGIFTTSGQNVTVKNLSGMGVISPGGSATFNMIIVMPMSKPTVINNLQAVGDGSPSPIPAPNAPVLNPITLSTSNSYTVSWSSVASATSYNLEESQSASFTNPQTIFNGNNTSFLVSGKPAGTYYYRAETIANGLMSAPSNIQSITVTQPQPPPIPQGIEHAAWYIDWTSWFTGPPFVIPTGVNMLNVFVGELNFDSAGNPTLDGFGNMTLPQLDAFTAYCRAQTPPIAVKVSIGGSGGMYDACWDRLTSTNVQAFAQGMADFCHAHGVVGVDFDYEHYTSAAQEGLVGTLIKEFKAIDPNFQTSLCTNAGFGPNFPWQAHIKNVLDAALIGAGNCAVDRLYIMSYYDPIQNEETWINGWANWVIQNYGFTPARVSVGIDDFDAHAYDPVAFAAWAASQGYSTAHWAFDPAHPN